MQYCRELPIKRDTDVLVAGGGPAGIAAAVACARVGARVTLLENSGVLGGMSALALVPELMNFDDGKNFLANGIGREIYTRLFGACAYTRQTPPVAAEKLKLLYDELITSSGVSVLFFTRLIDAVCVQGEITHAVVSGPEGMYAIPARIFIDCTGTGELSVFAGAQSLYGDENGTTMAATLCSIWAGVDFEKKGPGNDGEFLGQAMADGVITRYDTVLPGIKATMPECGVGGGNIGHLFHVRTDDTESMTRAMFEGRQMLTQYQQYYRRYIGGCEKASVYLSADTLGVRESRRIVCDYMARLQDFNSGETFPDEIGRYSYPVDIHPQTADAKGMQDFNRHISMRHGDGESYSISYRSLLPAGTQNLLVAGKCLGADRYMQATMRVIPCCYITGQAAGAAAALCVQKNVLPRQIDIPRLQTALRGL